MIAPGNGAEELYVNTLVAHRVRAVRLAQEKRVPGERPWQRYDQAFRDCVEKVGPAFPERNLGLVEWAELRAREVLAGEIDPAVEAILNPLPEPEVAEKAPEPTPTPTPEPEKKPEPKKEAPKAEAKKEAPKPQPKPAEKDWFNTKPAEKKEAPWANSQPAKKKAT